MAKLKIGELFIKCPNCGRFKNANYKHTDTKATATCFCGTFLTKNLKLKNVKEAKNKNTHTH
jgi:uncharacterized C2H2 Zn-finger protein